MPKALLFPTTALALALAACNKPGPEPAGAAPVAESAMAGDSVATTDTLAPATDSTVTVPADTGDSN